MALKVKKNSVPVRIFFTDDMKGILGGCSFMSFSLSLLLISKILVNSTLDSLLHVHNHAIVQSIPRLVNAEGSGHAREPYSASTEC